MTRAIDVALGMGFHGSRPVLPILTKSSLSSSSDPIYLRDSFGRICQIRFAVSLLLGGRFALLSSGQQWGIRRKWGAASNLHDVGHCASFTKHMGLSCWTRQV